VSDGVGAGLAGSDADCLFDVGDKNLAIANTAGLGSIADCLDGLVHHVGSKNDLDFDLRQEVDNVFSATVKLGVTFLTAKSLGLGHCDALQADFLKSFFDLIEFERFDDRFDLFHHRMSLSTVDVALLKDPGCLAGDAKLAFEDMVASSDMPSWSLIDVADLSARLYGADIVVDALLGAGLDRPLEGPLADIIQAANGAGARVLAVDLPTGLSGLTGEVLGCAIEADVTVTFFRAKPGHLLFPGRSLCGDLKCVDIGIDRDVLRSIKPRTFQNGPGIWSTEWMPPQTNGHKYSRGHAVVFSGPSTTTGAARLAAGAALRAGAGLVTVASPPSAVLVNAVHLTAVMLRSVSGPDGAAGLLSDARLNSVLIGPGYGVGKTCRQTVEAILSADCAVVLDADALTSFSEDPSTLFAILENRSAPVVLTPHAGEFGRLFPDLAQQGPAFCRPQGR
jgi:hypothetical protein